MLDGLKIGTFTEEFVQLIRSFKQLVCLTMNACNITSLKGFPTDVSIQRIELIDNQFPAEDLVVFGDIKVTPD